MITPGFNIDIEKQHWEKYQIVQAKSHQYKHYKISKMSKHEICKYKGGKNGTSKYRHLATFIKSCHRYYINVEI